jgi:Cu+-exporting ATPase
VAAGTEPQVETPSTYTPEAETAIVPVTDPVCGMTVDPGTAPEHRGTGPGTVYFCSAGCAAAFDTDPARHARAAAAVIPTR